MRKVLTFFCLLVLLKINTSLAADALIWNPNNVATTSAQAIQTALTANGKTSIITTDLKSQTFSNYVYVFFFLRVNPSTYVLSSSTNATEIQNLINYLNQGGKLYMEGGDTWAWDFPTSLHARFYINGEADGEGDLAEIRGVFCSGDVVSSYTMSQKYIDRLAPQEGASVFFTNQNPAYACGVGYDNSVYRTLGISFQFGGWQSGSRTSLMALILQFFNTGCTLGKPAPLFVKAFGGYDHSVPLVWEPPSGQIPLGIEKEHKPAALFSSASDDRNDNVNERERAERKLNDRIRESDLPQPMISSYQASSYRVYRAVDQSGPFSLLASNIEKQFYRDDTAQNGLTYYYKIKAVYDGVEGDFSALASASPAEGGQRIVSPWKFQSPELNGLLQPDEWSNAYSILITRPGSSSPVTLYGFNDDRYLYLAIDDAANASLDVDDQIGLYFDKDLDLKWGVNSFNEEGNYWFARGNSTLNKWYRGLRGWWPFDLEWANAVSANGVEAVSSTSSGHTQYEIKIDLDNSILDSSPGSDLGLYLYSFAMADSIYTGAWPSDILSAPWKDAWMMPALYGRWALSARDVCPWISDDEQIAATGSFEFNEFGDGRRLGLDVTAVSGNGVITVTQTNGCLQNPINDRYINCVWSVSSSSGLTSLSGEVFISYNDEDVSSLDESKLQLHRWNGSTWQFEGGLVNTVLNRVSAQVDLPGEFALFERDFVLLSVKAFLEGAYQGGGLMRTDLTAQNYLPLTSTFSDTRVVKRVPTDIVDWVSIELRSSAAGPTVSQRSFFLKTNGNAVEWDGAITKLSLPDVVSGNYYVVLRQRNHLAIMSALSIALNSATPTLYDFSASLGQFYGSDGKLLEAGIYGAFTGDANSNGQVQNDDKNDFWKAQVGLNGYQSADFNLNGEVQNDDNNDYWKSNVGKGTQVP
ncbi:MAG: hypothetical protein EHM72_02180 [Calditrichaeota bacterium]|nr:MAG: hypothetical protein EHM72_02180 [Calditrichota bacterium]